jgi:regulator of cell morphogenesis and NO signaling
MKPSLIQQPVGLLVRERQSRAAVLERYGIDYCCHGDVSLAAACRQAHVPVEDVCRQLDAGDSSLRTEDEIDWSHERLAQLVNHIESRHHTYLRKQLPLLSARMDKTIAAHGSKHPELLSVRELLRGMQAELVSHMMREERVLFPIVIQLEEAALSHHDKPHFHCGSVSNPIGVMEDEHVSVGHTLCLLRRLTHDFTPPEDACETYRGLLGGLEDLEADLHLHIHLENNILFPRAAALESTLDVGPAIETCSQPG